MRDYPVRIEGNLDPSVSRGLWLVKWLLAIPHYIVLAFLWLAVVVVSVVAFFAVLFTGRYPRSLFDFVTGVLRWSWRVAFYAYSALGTDRYPPFTLADVPDYPARLTVDYPPRLSRGLVLVKWLLIIPQLLVVGLLVGGGPYLAYRLGDSDASLGGGGLIGLLVFIAGVVLLFTGRYPRELFDLIMGLDRWVYRVAGYVLLLTDEYPPFAFDGGRGQLEPTGPAGRPVPLTDTPPVASTDPFGTSAAGSGTPASSAPGAAGGPYRPTDSGPAAGAPGGPTDSGPAAGAPYGPTGSGPVAGAPYGGGRPVNRWTAGRVISVVVGSLLVIAGIGTLPAGAVGLWFDQTGRDSNGYIGTDLKRFSSPGYAITSEPGALHFDGPAWVMNSVLGDVRITGVSATSAPLFLGVARESEVSAYLAPVQHTVIHRIDRNSPEQVSDEHAGQGPATQPAGEQFWDAKATGPGKQSLDWAPRAGDWSVVVMNADGSRPTQADLAVAATFPWLDNVSIAFIAAGLVFLLAGAVLIAVPVHRSQRPHVTTG